MSTETGVPEASASTLMVRAVRGAITVRRDSREAVLDSTERLLRELLGRNGIAAGDVVSILFTATPDVRSAFPAEAARLMGLDFVPLICAAEMDVPGALPACIRVLMHVHSRRTQQDIEHVYLEGAQSLRPDLG
jgi:chorismate mutase